MPGDDQPARDTRAAILDAGRGLLLRDGYAATGLKDVLEAAGVPKGSFYHYFDSKEAFALAVVDDYFAEHAALLEQALADTRRPPLARLRRYFEGYARRYAQDGHALGCLLGTLGQEVAASHDGFRLALADHFAAWRDRLRACLAEAQRAGELAADADPAELAGYVLDAWEGALLQMKVARSARPVRAFLHVTFGRVLTP